MSPKNDPEVSRISGSYFGCMVKYSMSRKTNFLNEIIEVWRTLSTYILMRNIKYLIHTYENFWTYSSKVSSLESTLALQYL